MSEQFGIPMVYDYQASNVVQFIGPEKVREELTELTDKLAEHVIWAQGDTVSVHVLLTLALFTLSEWLDEASGNGFDSGMSPARFYLAELQGLALIIQASDMLKRDYPGMSPRTLSNIAKQMGEGAGEPGDGKAEEDGA